MSFGRQMLPPTEASLLDILRERAQAAPERVIFSYLEDGEYESDRLTYAQLEQEARAVAADLQHSTVPGDRALLVYPPGLEFISALFGCFYAGVIAVPVCPPRLELTLDPYRPLLGIIRDCEPAAVLTGSHYADTMRTLVQTLPSQPPVRVLASEQVELGRAEEWRPSSITRDTMALLQYTSGSTGEPKGVVLSHGNILANEFVIQLTLQHKASRPGRGVCWLPFYHDMGLIGNILQAVYVDGPCWLMSPLTLLQHPVRWLQAITRYQAHSSGGPNFAYDVCVRRVTEAQKQTLDLSHWEVAAIGAEPISTEVMDRFAEAFGPCGFRREAFYPGYGLAEATLYVTGGDKEALPIVRSFSANEIAFRESAREAVETAASADSRLLVGCGRTWTDHELLIVDPRTRQPCGDGTVGEIWFRGPSVAQGYWRREAETEATFRGFLRESGDGPFLRTGDLGFLCDGELFVSGRLKDLIVIRGQNHYPQDIEETVAGLHEAFRPNSTAAIGCLIDAQEQLVILQEIDRLSRKLDLDRLRQEIRSAISEQYRLLVHDIVFLRKNSLPKTTSGKIRRNASRERYQAERLSLWTGVPTA